MRGHLQMMDNAAQANQEVGPQADDLPAILRPWRLDKGTSRIESGASSLRSLARPLIPIVNVGVGIGGEGAILFEDVDPNRPKSRRRRAGYRAALAS